MDARRVAVGKSAARGGTAGAAHPCCAPRGCPRVPAQGPDGADHAAGAKSEEAASAGILPEIHALLSDKDAPVQGGRHAQSVVPMSVLLPGPGMVTAVLALRTPSRSRAGLRPPASVFRRWNSSSRCSDGRRRPTRRSWRPWQLDCWICTTLPWPRGMWRQVCAYIRAGHGLLCRRRARWASLTCPVPSRRGIGRGCWAAVGMSVSVGTKRQGVACNTAAVEYRSDPLERIRRLARARAAVPYVCLRACAHAWRVNACVRARACIACIPARKRAFRGRAPDVQSTAAQIYSRTSKPCLLLLRVCSHRPPPCHRTKNVGIAKELGGRWGEGKKRMRVKLVRAQAYHVALAIGIARPVVRLSTIHLCVFYFRRAGV